MELTKDEIERFFSKIKKVDSGCWEWISGVYVTGYGMFCLRRGNRKTFSAHRISWIIHNKTNIPDKMMVCYKCDNRLCVNPDHLYAGTGYDNNRDTVIRNRGNRKVGSKCSWAKLTEEIVRIILNSTEKQSVLSRRYNIDQPSISNIKHRKSWKHVSLQG